MQSADLGTASGGVKIRSLVGNPAQEATDIRTCFRDIEIRKRRRKVLIQIGISLNTLGSEKNMMGLGLEELISALQQR